MSFDDVQVTFGQVVIGPPGSGKSTYCAAVQRYFANLGRKMIVINMDPANDTLPYDCAVNISDLITVSDVMNYFGLGPNGALIYCLEYLEKNIEWLLKCLQPFRDHYIVFDFPGQVELYVQHRFVRNILRILQKNDMRLVALHLVDSHYCSDASQFISVLLTSLSTMLQLELPHLNILSKADLIEHFGRLDFNLEFYTDVLDLSRLIDLFKMDQDEHCNAKFRKLNAALASIIEDYSLVSFSPLDIQDPDSLQRLCGQADKAIGYINSDEAAPAQAPLGNHNLIHSLTKHREHVTSDLKLDETGVAERLAALMREDSQNR